MKAFQRISTYTFLIGYVGFLATWILDTVAMVTFKPGVKHANRLTKLVLRTISPHFALARCLGLLYLPCAMDKGKGEPRAWECITPTTFALGHWLHSCFFVNFQYSGALVTQRPAPHLMQIMGRMVCTAHNKAQYKR